MERISPYPRRSHGRMGEDESFDVPWRSKACREKSAEVIVPKARVLIGKDWIVQCNSKWMLPCETPRQMSEKELSIQDDRTESDNRIEVTLLIGIAENNLPHIARWESTKPPYAEPHVRWCGRSVNVKIGGKCLLWLAFTSYPIFMRQFMCILCFVCVYYDNFSFKIR